MRAEILAFALLVGASTWAFRALPFRFDLSGLAPDGWVARLLSATGPAAIAALFVASVLPYVGGAQQGPLWIGSATVIAFWFWRRSVVLATVAGAVAFGLAAAL